MDIRLFICVLGFGKWFIVNTSTVACFMRIIAHEQISMNVNTHVPAIYGWLHTATHLSRAEPLSPLCDWLPFAHVSVFKENKISALHESRGLPKISMISPTPTLPQVSCGSIHWSLVSKLWDAVLQLRYTDTLSWNPQPLKNRPSWKGDFIFQPSIFRGDLLVSGRVSTATVTYSNKEAFDIFTSLSCHSASSSTAASYHMQEKTTMIWCHRKFTKKMWFVVIPMCRSFSKRKCS